MFFLKQKEKQKSFSYQLTRPSNKRTYAQHVQHKFLMKLCTILQFGRVAMQLIKTNILLQAAQNLHRSMLPFPPRECCAADAHALIRLQFFLLWLLIMRYAWVLREVLREILREVLREVLRESK